MREVWLSLLLLAGCTPSIRSDAIRKGVELCELHGELKSIQIESMSSELFQARCNDGALFRYYRDSLKSAFIVDGAQ
jgi:hypothetical protein